MTLKTKSIRFSDSGFLKKSNQNTFIQLFNAGTLVLDLEVKKDYVCLNKICLKNARFNKKFLSKYYDDDFLKNILNKKPIFNAQNIKYHDNNFTQNIKNRFLDIIYVSNDNIIKFKDKKNSIFIKIKALN